MHAMTRAGLLLCLCLGLAACPRPVQPPAPAPSVPPSAPSAPPAEVPGATTYRIDPQASMLHILVYRGGKFSKLGHNHVVSSKSLTGRVWMHPQLAQSGFEIAFPVADLIVDDPDARRAAGSEVPPEIPDADKQGTRKNMLRAEVLDAENYPRVELKSAKIEGTLPNAQVTARITIKQATRDIVVPVNVTVTVNRLTASGEFAIQQTEFGMKPFSVAMGALEVKDRLDVRFNIVALKR
jgi:polyisoprenoid-binding protein YceI